MITPVNTISHSSPTAEYFERIIKTATILLGGEVQQPQGEASINLPDSLVLSVIAWTKSIFEEAQKFEQQVHADERGEHGVVMANTQFRNLFFAVINLSCKRTTCKAIVKPCLMLVKKILREFPLMGPETRQVSEVVRDCAMLHLKSTFKDLREITCEILCLIPPMIGHWITHDNLTKRLDMKERISLATVNELDHMKINFLARNNSNLKPTDFKVLMDDLLKGPTSPNIFPFSQSKVFKHLEAHFDQAEERIAQADNSDRKRLIEYILTNFDVQSFWIGYHLAQFCVNSKLKTPLGKAQETLTTIEKVVRQLTSNVTASTVTKATTPSDTNNKSPTGATKSSPSFVLNVSECRRLLTFYELLEKSMANAWDGSAYHWSGPYGGKPITSFFMANQRTCHDWLSRLRVTVVQLAFYVGEYAFAVRNAYEALGMKLRCLTGHTYTKQVLGRGCGGYIL